MAVSEQPSSSGVLCKLLPKQAQKVLDRMVADHEQVFRDELGNTALALAFSIRRQVLRLRECSDRDFHGCLGDVLEYCDRAADIYRRAMAPTFHFEVGKQKYHVTQVGLRADPTGFWRLLKETGEWGEQIRTDVVSGGTIETMKVALRKEADAVSRQLIEYFRANVICCHSKDKRMTFADLNMYAHFVWDEDFEILPTVPQTSCESRAPNYSVTSERVSVSDLKTARGLWMLENCDPMVLTDEALRKKVNAQATKSGWPIFESGNGAFQSYKRAYLKVNGTHFSRDNRGKNKTAKQQISNP